jgi:glycosyltransferase involved in cell wall biosynthesis
MADLRRVAASRLQRRQRVRDRLADRQRAAFDAAVARELGARDGAVLTIAGWAPRTMRRARELGLSSAVDCPLGHHGFVRDLMREEAKLKPEWAKTLQIHDFSDEAIQAQVEELASADLVITLSSCAKRTLLERGVEESKLEVTPLGVDLELFRPRVRPADGIFRVIFVGQVTQRKGISYLVEAFEKAAVGRSELMLVGEVIGSADPWRGRPGIRHVTTVPRNELPAYYRPADVFVLPSLAEGFGLTALEAMASGIPVIISTNTFADDVLTDGQEGFIVPIRDANAIAERLLALAADPDRRAQMGKAARARAEQYPWSRYGNQIVEIMRDVLRSPPS